jgi:hypothetical protein
MPGLRADPIALCYALNVGGFQAAEAHVTLQLPPAPLPPAGGPYAIETRLETQGMAAMVVPFLSRTDSQGLLFPPSAPQALWPLAHHARTHWRDQTRRVDLIYPPSPNTPAAEGLWPAPSVTATPLDSDRTPVATRETAGSLDPLAATMSLMVQTSARGKTGQGALSQLVFDGRRLYRLSLGSFQAADVSTPAYQGPGWRTEITYERLGGRSKESFFKLSDQPLTARLDLAPGPALGVPYPVPLRVEADTLNFGGLVILLTDASPLSAPCKP